MSFSATPLGQGRRLDHHTFLNKPPPPPNPPHRTIPTSYAYGAPAPTARSPAKPTSSLPRDGNPSSDHEPALARFARLKHRDHQPDITNRPGGPKTISSPPKPETWSVKDTSVNIATAFHQAVSTIPDMPPITPNDAWASNSRPTTTVPRSTSVEYEQQSQSTHIRRLAPPPNRLAAARAPTSRKPPSKTSSSARHSGGEEDPEPINENGRGKSPFEHVVDITKRAIAPATFYLRQRSQEPANTSRKDSSYDYSAEEREFQATQPQRSAAPRRTSAAHKRGRISTDNKAYRPTASDLEDDDDDFEDDGKKGKRRKKKKDLPGGPLTTLPVASYDKKKKKKRGSKGNTAEVEDDAGSISDDHASDQSVHQESAPPISHVSTTRALSPPLSLQGQEDVSMDIEQGLESIEEVNEADFMSPSSAQIHSRRPFSLGGFLGICVNRIYQVFAYMIIWILTLVAKLLQLLWMAIELIICRPILWAVRGTPGILSISKYLFIAGTVYAAWYTLRNPVLQWLPLLSSSSTIFQASDIPPANMAELTVRLQKIESALSGLALDYERSRTRLENEAKKGSEVVGRLGSLETQMQKENVRVAQAENQLRQLTNQGLLTVKQEVEALQAHISAHRGQDTGGNDGEARAKLEALEERLGGLEGGVKEALELGRKDGVSVATTTSVAWWNKLLAGGASHTGLTIKSVDGQDVTALIGHLVGSAVSQYGKDVVARADFAMHSAGGQIIPFLTSPTFSVSPSTLSGKFIGLLTGNGQATGRPPITALHHELHSGYCWSFPGTQGQLGVVLSAPTHISDVTIDHIAKEVAFDMRSAPREMELWGLVEGKDNLAKLKEWQAEKARKREAAKATGAESGTEFAEEQAVYPPTLPKSQKFVRLASFAYNIHAPSNIQTFPVSQEVRDLGVDFGVVVLVVKSNWGMEEYTCLYRLRVHGQRVGEVPLPYPEDLA